MTRSAVFFSALFLSITLLFSCNDKEGEGGGGNTSRNVKYEITGNYSGKLVIIYNDNVNGNTILNDVTLPWSKEITIPANVRGIGIGAQSSTLGVAGQTVTLKIFQGGNVVKTSSGTADANGAVGIPTLSHIF